MIYSMARARLGALGCPPEPAEEALLRHFAEKTERDFLIECSLDTLPGELRAFAADAACGEFLFYLRAAGRLDGFDAGAAVKQLKEGDSTVTYALTGEPVCADSLIHNLACALKSKTGAYRRLKW